jgi:putative oxidoreductase
MNEQTSLEGYRKNIQICLFLLRITVFIVMFAWTVDKFVDPGHSINILQYFYFIDGASEIIVKIIGGAEMLLIFAFVAGLWKKYTYGLILLFHGLTTFASWKAYIPPDVTLTFFAAWPMLAACITLYLLRDLDIKFSL